MTCLSPEKFSFIIIIIDNYFNAISHVNYQCKNIFEIKSINRQCQNKYISIKVLFLDMKCSFSAK